MEFYANVYLYAPLEILFLGHAQQIINKKDSIRFEESIKFLTGYDREISNY